MKTRLLSIARLSFPLAAALAALLSATSASAAIITWDANAAAVGQTDGAAVSGNWNTGSNWWNGSTNVSWATDDSAIFGNGGAGGAVGLTVPTTVGSLTFNYFTGAYTLGTATQTINSITTVPSQRRPSTRKAADPAPKTKL